MGKELKVYYFSNKSLKLLIDEVTDKYDIWYDDFIDTFYLNENTKNAVHKFIDNIDYYSKNTTQNLVFDKYNNYEGTKYELRAEIITLAKELGDYTIFNLVGHLSFILSECPENFNYIFIENS